jgi:DNA-binding phage protein
MTVKYSRKTQDVPNVYVPEPDWQQLLLKLRQRGYPIAAIARVAGVTRDALYGVLKGRANPTWHAGAVILKLGEDNG